ncbi:MAG: TerC family protein [Bernardetiaceae bacterium]|jgi:predicted tellurium resistance membrane protein TerC|nr:TerC family protein [Bernardetiaceae bacterium]
MYDFDFLLTSAGLVSLFTLTALEIVLGIDNVIFISIIASRLPANKVKTGRTVGLASALIVRLLLLLVVQWIISLEEPMFDMTNWFGFNLYEVFHLDGKISGKDIILIIGGLFLIGKSVSEIHAKMENASHGPETAAQKAAGFMIVMAQIIFIDIVFSFDSILTAIGLVKNIIIMAIAIIISIGVMIAFVNQISEYVERHPTVKMLALSFLIMIGLLLVSEGFGFHFPKGYVYFAMAYSFIVELLNIRLRKKSGASF